MESSGGQNIWGHDAVATGGAYVKGGPVTEENYKAYIAAVAAGKAGRQGVGPTQLTWGGFQTEADKRGACWRWEINLAYGFEILAGHIRAKGVKAGYTAYNGAEAYGVKAVKLLGAWEPRFSS